MTKDEARQRAEERVYIYLTAESIAIISEKLGFNVRFSKNGRLLNRGELEDKLIDYYTTLAIEQAKRKCDYKE